jgi:hypothetical protein
MTDETNLRPCELRRLRYDQQNEQIASLCRTHCVKEIAVIVSLSYNATGKRLYKMGLRALRPRNRRMPTKAEWVSIATQEARSARLSPVRLMAGDRTWPYARARWRAWAAILESNPMYSIKGVATVSFFDHTTVIYGLARLKGKSAKRIPATNPKSPHAPTTR